jgi:hypothetical protein
MKLANHQQGMTLFGVAFTLLLIGFATFTTLKLFPAYMQNFNVKGSLKSIEADRSQEYLGAVAVRDRVLKRLDINDVTQVDKEDIRIKRDGGLYLIDIDYEVRIPFMSNISLLIEFKNHAEVSAR